MVASPSALEQGPADTAAEMIASMEAHAASGDWERVEEVAAKLRIAVMQVPERERRQTVIAARRGIENVQTAARNARTDVTEKLSAIRRGQNATAAYTNTD